MNLGTAEMQMNPIEIASTQMSYVTPAQEMRSIVAEAVAALGGRGQAVAASKLAREMGITADRVVRILRGEVGRVWADEWMAAKEWHRAHCERQAAICARQAEEYRIKADELKGRMNEGTHRVGLGSALPRTLTPAAKPRRAVAHTG